MSPLPQYRASHFSVRDGHNLPLLCFISVRGGVLGRRASDGQE